MTQEPRDETGLPGDSDRTLDADATLPVGEGMASSPIPGVPATIGPYRIIRRLGEGGMGEVYLADQTHPIKRLVALKIIKLGMDSRQVVARFELERQTLALMSHPNIAQVFDAGQTEQGRPYFVMEYVEGIAINAYCDARRLSTEQRLELVAEVCAGVQHAHQKAIIHRDLKPGNILITEVDGKPVPKIIDFGVARATEQRELERTMFTQAGHVVGTPAYMSPEQTDPTNTDIDTRTDIYSLGVVLYELLVGFKPFDIASVYSAGYDAIMKFVREQEPPRPSLRFRDGGEQTTEIAQRHSTEPAKLVRTLRGDLDWILLKALEKDRSRRYETANALAMDIRRYLENQPVLASPPSAAYLTRKFVRRHRGGVAVALATALVLIAFTVTTSIQKRAISQARDVAELESAKANAINNFLKDMLINSDPWSSGDHDLTVVEAMDAARADVDSIFAEQLLVAAEMHATMGQTYLGLGKLTEAEEEIRQGIAQRVAQLGNDHIDLADSYLNLSKLQRLNMVPDEGIAAAEEVVRIRKMHLPENHPDILAGYDNLAELYLSDRKFAEADSALDLADQIVAASQVDMRQQTASILSLRARVAAESRNDMAEADSLSREGIRLLKASNPNSPLLPIYLNNMAVNQVISGDLEGAQETYQESLDLVVRLFGEDHPEYAIVRENLGGIAYRQGNYEECLANLEKVRDIRARNMGEDHPTVMRTMLNMATVANGMGNSEKAIRIYEEVLPLLTEVNGEVHLDTATTLRNLALALKDAGRYSEAEKVIARARPIFVELFGESHSKVALVDGDLGVVRMHQGRWSEAETLTLSSLEMFEETLEREDPRIQKAAVLLVKIYEELGRPEEAARYRGYAVKD
jgi:serine/threonine protein kinase|nr:serine/threonine-protein kinase [Candidatus Krumholzibacteria bacterium]